MRGLLSRTPRLDFLVIGAQKAGTTSLWRYLEDNPRVRMPSYKEATFFTEPGYPDELRGYMRALFKDAPRRARLGTVTPAYMYGAHGVSVPEVAGRIRRTAPDVRLVALLRDPVERAHSAHRISVQAYGETRPFAQAIHELIEPAALERERTHPTVTNDTYVVAGEYWRILESYLAEFDREQLLVEFTADLASDPLGAVERVCGHIGVEPHVPARMGERFYPSGRARVDPEAEAEVIAYLDRHVWPRMRHAAQHRHHFEFWFKLWNSLPEPPEPIDPEAAALLRAHYVDDTARLEEMLGVEVPWSRGL